MILLSSLSESFDHIVIIILFGKETLILEEVMSTHLSNEIRKKPNQVEQTGSDFVVTGRKGRGEGRKGPNHQRRITFVTGKVIGRMIASIGKSD